MPPSQKQLTPEHSVNDQFRNEVINKPNMSIKTEIQDTMDEDSMQALENDLIDGSDEMWPNFDTFHENAEEYYGYDGASLDAQEEDYNNFNEKPQASKKTRRKRKGKKSDGTFSSLKKVGNHKAHPKIHLVS